MRIRSLLAAFALSCAFAAPQLTTIQDVLYKADGTPFNGTVTIAWTSFQAADGSTIATQSTSVRVVAGNLRVQLVPTSSATPAVYYNVTYNSDGRVQFQETWLVPSSAAPVRLRDVRVATTSGAGSVAADTGGGSSSPVAESGIVGLIADLASRPMKGAGFAAGRAAVIDGLGALESATGNAGDCVHVDGSSGPCGANSPSFMDADSLSGIVDGSNVTFTLSGAPSPASSLAVYRNGVLQKAGSDYTLSGSGIQFVGASTPQPGDTLLASYRLGTASGGTVQLYPSPQVLCSGTGTAAGTSAMATIGTCSIPGGLLAAGDRVQIQFDLEHQGTAGGFTFNLAWGATSVVERSGAAGDALVSVRAEAAITSAGAQLSGQSWGAVLPFAASVLKATDSYSGGLTINFQGLVAQTGDTLTLRGYSVVRVP